MKRTIHTLTFLLAVLPLGISASTLTITSRCQLQAVPDVIGSSSCEITNPENGRVSARASGSLTVTLADSPSEFTSIHAGMGAYATYVGSQTPPFYGYSGSLVQVNFADVFLTSGNERNGYIEVMPSGDAHGYDGHAIGRFTVPPATNGLSISAGCTAYSVEANCTSTYYFERFRPFPVVLGTEFPITFSGEAGAGSSFENTSQSIFSYQYAFRFFESDGVTPVAVAETPEPATLGLVLFPLLWLGYRTRKRADAKGC